jgi:hypothetical protein
MAQTHTFHSHAPCAVDAEVLALPASPPSLAKKAHPRYIQQVHTRARLGTHYIPHAQTRLGAQTHTPLLFPTHFRYVPFWLCINTHLPLPRPHC